MGMWVPVSGITSNCDKFTTRPCNFQLPGDGIVPKDPGELQGQGSGEDNAARGLGKPEDVFQIGPTGGMKLLLEDAWRLWKCSVATTISH